jgi:hypothetical protein
MERDYKRFPPEVNMSLSKSEAALIAIAVALWVYVLFGAALLD